MNAITLTGKQILEAAQLVVPDWILVEGDIPDKSAIHDDTLRDELETEVTIVLDDRRELYAYITDYPEEGKIDL